MSQPSPQPRRWPIRFIWVILPLALLAAAVGWLTRAKPVEVALVEVARGTVEATVSNTRAGTVKACHRAKLAPPAGGQIVQLKVQKGQRVQAHQVLLELWNNDLQAQAGLAQQQLDAARLQSQQSCSQADSAEKEWRRSVRLAAQGFISAEALEQRELAAKVARSGCEVAGSQIEQSRSRLAVAQAGLERLVLRAPFDGIVADVSGELGEYATPSPPGIPTPPAIDLIEDGCLFVSAPIDEVDAAAIKAGQPARITLDAIKGKSFAARVKRVAPYVLELEKQARTVEVEVEFAERPQQENLLVGYSADVEIMHTVHSGVLRIPTQALLPAQTGQMDKRVLVYGRDGVLEERRVATGISNWEQTEIVSGLSEGERIVLSLERPGVKAGAKAQADAARQ